MKIKYILLLLFISLLSFVNVKAQNLPNREFRGVWVATVGNLDWPVSGASAASQKAHLQSIFDKVKEANLNVVFFQVRTECDAFYNSSKEPWSRFLTGTQGVNPGYDPLAFAIEEAHKRGLELHAWFNPYRVNYSTSASIVYANNHVSKTKPEWLLNFSTNKQILNPGIPEVREYIVSVVREVAENYDIDGVHFDDYFYPYPEGTFTGISNEDAATFTQYGNAFTNNKDWRRNNINETIRTVNNALKAVKPGIRFGVSPFGIWKNGTPTGITGMDAYNVIYADALAWYQNQYVDYLTPQLYWVIGGAQDYQKLLEWWADKSQTAQRHLYPGHIVNKTGFTVAEVPNQINITRANRNKNALGAVIFRAADVVNNTNQIHASFKNTTFKLPAAPPVMDWKTGTKPAAPANVTVVKNNITGNFDIFWSRAAGNTHTFKRYLVYTTSVSPANTTAIPDGSVQAFTSSETVSIPTADFPANTSFWTVTEVGTTNIESDLSNVVTINNAVTGLKDAEENIPVTVYPNPSDSDINISFTLEKKSEVQLQLLTLDGKMQYESKRKNYQTVNHNFQIKRNNLPPGIYMLVLTVDKTRTMKKVILK